MRENTLLLAADANIVLNRNDIYPLASAMIACPEPLRCDSLLDRQGYTRRKTKRTNVNQTVNRLNMKKFNSRHVAVDANEALIHNNKCNIKKALNEFRETQYLLSLLKIPGVGYDLYEQPKSTQ